MAFNMALTYLHFRILEISHWSQLDPNWIFPTARSIFCVPENNQAMQKMISTDGPDFRADLPQFYHNFYHIFCLWQTLSLRYLWVTFGVPTLRNLPQVNTAVKSMGFHWWSRIPGCHLVPVTKSPKILAVLRNFMRIAPKNAKKWIKLVSSYNHVSYSFSTPSTPLKVTQFDP